MILDDKMNIALCLYGHVGIPGPASDRKTEDLSKESIEATTDPKYAAYSFRQQILQRYNTSVFIHTWSTDQMETLAKLYEPTMAIYEPQIDFAGSLEDYGIIGDNIQDWKVSEDAKKGYEFLLPSRGSVVKIKDEMQRQIFRSRSRWYSTQKSIQLKAMFERKSGQVFDLVMVSRLDCDFQNDVILDDKDPTKIYASFRNHRKDKDFALFDFYFMGGSQVIDEFGKLYDYCEDYCLRPTVACREHIKRFIGDENLRDFLRYNIDYKKVEYE